MPTACIHLGCFFLCSPFPLPSSSAQPAMGRKSNCHSLMPSQAHASGLYLCPKRGRARPPPPPAGLSPRPPRTVSSSVSKRVGAGRRAWPVPDWLAAQEPVPQKLEKTFCQCQKNKRHAGRSSLELGNSSLLRGLISSFLALFE